MKIIKRNGVEVDFDASKISNAIRKANQEVPESARLSESWILAVTEDVVTECEAFMESVTVEQVQDIVQNCLIRCGAALIATKYITYRHTRELARKANTTDEAILSLIELSNEEAKTENANKNPVIVSTQRDYMAGEVSKDLTHRILLPQDIVKAHDAGIIHFHDSDYYSQHMHNCFSGATSFITNRGIRQFRDFNDGDVVVVKDKDGQLREATVHLYGQQNMNKVTLQTNKMSREVVCTANHRWILADGSVTTNLKVGDKLACVVDSTNANVNTYDEANAFCLGFILGDGVDLKTDAMRVRLCGNKTQYKKYFVLAGFTEHKDARANEVGDIIMYRAGANKQNFINGKSWRYLPAYLQALVFKGYYAADGAKNDNKVCTSDERMCDFIEETSGLAGYYITSKTEEVRDTQYKNNSKLFAYHFLTKQDDSHGWKVTKIEKYQHTNVNAYCVEEPITHSFTLAGGIVTGNCDVFNLEDMLQNGTVISGTLIEKPHSFSTACNIATQVVAQVASSQYGGQTFSLAHLAPFVDVSRQKLRRDVRQELEQSGVAITDEQVNAVAESRVKEEVKKGVQTIQYQLITLMTTNGQAPFVSVFMYLDEAKDQQTKDDLAMIIEEVLIQRIQGVKNEKGIFITPAFPKLLYVTDENNIHAGSKYYYLTELAAKCTAKRMVPDYISAKKMKELKNGNVYPCMGCRSFLTTDRFTENGIGNIARAKNYVEGQQKYYGRFNQGVVTINLPDVACASYGDMDKFWEILEERLELCHKALRCRHERLLGTVSDVAPILWQHGALARLEKGEVIDKLLYDGYSTISLGYSGLYEMCVRMTGKSHTDPAAKPFALAVMQKLNDKCAEWKAAENIDYSVYGTPMESTTYKFAKATQKRYGIIKDVTDHNYQTNSYHVVVREEIDAFTKLAFESEFQKLSPGGAISYVEIPNMQDNIAAVIKVIQYMYDTIMYAELNTKSDYCQICGYEGEIEIVEDENTPKDASGKHKLIWRCPNCGNTNHDKMNVARRVCGYIGTNDFNQGRMGDVHDRVIHLSCDQVEL